MRPAAAPSRLPRPGGGYWRSQPFQSFPFLGRKAPIHHVERLHFVGPEAAVSIGRVDPELPAFPPPAAALVGDVVDPGEERSIPVAGIAEGYAVRVGLRCIHHVEDRAA